MSTFYMVVNLDKRERLDHHDFGCTPKLHLCIENPAFCAALLVLLGDRWKGDRIALIDEHADLYLEADEWPSPWEQIKGEVHTLLGITPPVAQ